MKITKIEIVMSTRGVLQLFENGKQFQGCLQVHFIDSKNQEATMELGDMDNVMTITNLFTQQRIADALEDLSTNGITRYEP